MNNNNDVFLNVILQGQMQNLVSAVDRNARVAKLSGLSYEDLKSDIYSRYPDAKNVPKKSVSQEKPVLSQDEALVELRKWISSQKAFRKLSIKLREEAAACPNKDFHKFSSDARGVTNFVKHEYDVNMDGAKKEFPDLPSAKF